MSRISIDIAHDLRQALREQPQDVVQEIRVGAALHYCHTRRLSLGQAARLARLDRGEAEVIALAEELRAHSALLDERASQAMAITRGLPVIGHCRPAGTGQRSWVHPSREALPQPHAGSRLV